LGEQNTKSDSYYKSLLFAYRFKTEGYDYEQIFLMGKKINILFETPLAVKHQYEKYKKYRSKLPVPIIK